LNCDDGNSCTNDYCDAGIGCVHEAIAGCSGCIDADGDGYFNNPNCGQVDCNDGDANIHPGAPELCDGKDNDCDGKVDDLGPQTCSVSNEFGVCYGLQFCLNGSWSACNAQVPAQEVCDGKDNDCDGIIDPENSVGCLNYYFDADGDGFGVDSMMACLCSPTGNYSAEVGGDCNDTNESINPIAVELCDGVDNNCNGLIDEGC
jgi:hypothetical protein